MENNNEGRINNKIKPKLKLEPERFKPEGPAPFFNVGWNMVKAKKQVKICLFPREHKSDTELKSFCGCSYNGHGVNLTARENLLESQLKIASFALFLQDSIQ